MKRTFFAILCVISALYADEAIDSGFPAQIENTDCEGLAPEMKDFASALNPANRALFCGAFDNEQRAAAMLLATQLNMDGLMKTPDEAVEEVSRDKNVSLHNLKCCGLCKTDF